MENQNEGTATTFLSVALGLLLICAVASVMATFAKPKGTKDADGGPVKQSLPDDPLATEESKYDSINRLWKAHDAEMAKPSSAYTRPTAEEMKKHEVERNMRDKYICELQEADGRSLNLNNYDIIRGCIPLHVTLRAVEEEAKRFAIIDFKDVVMLTSISIIGTCSVEAEESIVELYTSTDQENWGHLWNSSVGDCAKQQFTYKKILTKVATRYIKVQIRQKRVLHGSTVQKPATSTVTNLTFRGVR